VIGEVAGDQPQRLGRPTSATGTRVLDARDQSVPQGVTGELWIGGPRVAIGYRGSAARTTARFPEDPAVPGGRAFRTGERVRWAGDGSLELVTQGGRECAVRGHRVDLDEIERTLTRDPTVGDARVMAREIDGEQRLVACVVARDGAAVDGTGLRRRLRDQLAPFAVPDHVVPVPSIPQAESGGIDDRRLAVLVEQGRRQAAHVEPSSPQERAIAALWTELLGIERVGVHDNFFELGGHSLLAVQATLRLEERAGLRIDPRAMFFGTLEQVAAAAIPADGATDHTAR